jgi:ABC-type lipoprotein release transport system permease subunit
LDAGVYAGVAALFIVVALAASYFPARRAVLVDPAIALRA